MSNLRDYTQEEAVSKATDSKLGLVKGGIDTHINDNGEIEVLYSYAGPFKVTLSGTTATIDSGRIHNGTLPNHIVIPIQSSTLTVTENTLNAIWIEINQNGNVSFVKENQINSAPSISGEGTFFCILLALIVYNNGTPLIQQCHFGDIIINGISY